MSRGLGDGLTVDPTGDGENWYVFCRNNPISAKDRDGFYTGADDLAAFLTGGGISAGIELAFQVWHQKYDILRIFTAFIKGGLSSWVGLYCPPAVLAVSSFLDAIEETTRARLAGQQFRIGSFTSSFTNSMISGIVAGQLGKSMTKVIGKLSPKIQTIIGIFKNKFIKSPHTAPEKVNFDIVSIPSKKIGEQFAVLGKYHPDLKMLLEMKNKGELPANWNLLNLPKKRGP